MKQQIQRDFQQLQICKEENEKYKDMCTPERVIVDVDKVVPLCKGFCKVDGCGKRGCWSKARGWSPCGSPAAIVQNCSLL